MGKHVKRTYEEKKKIVEEHLNGTLQNDNRGAPKINNSKELEYEILKKSFALLKEIRSEQNK